MPTRLIREGIIDSDAVNQLDWPAEVFYRRLMSKVDDYGLFDARPAILRGHLFALRADKVREADISRWIAACVTAGLLALYEADGKKLGQMLNTQWQARSEPKHPLPPWGKGAPPGSVENGCKQPGTPAPLVVDGVVVEFAKPLAPQGGRFAEFWSAWPKNERKQDKKACAAKWKLHDFDRIADVILADIETKKRTQKWREGFIEAPEVYLNNRRWEDGVEPDGPRGAGGEVRLWHETAGGITAKGAELDVVQGEREAFPVFKARVFAAVGFVPSRSH